jgi:protein-disulfide isomerase
MIRKKPSWFVTMAWVAAAMTSASCTSGEKAADGKTAAVADEVLFDAEDRLDLGKSPLKGNPRAPVTIVEFSSYQCPFCGRVQPTLKRIAEEFGDDVRFVFKQHPLPMQANSRAAARASLAANAQGKFWEYHDLLLANQTALTEENFVAWAGQLGLDLDRFNADRNADWTNAQVDADLAVASRHNVRGTPNFLINGKPVTGAQPFDAFASVIREELAATRALLDAGKGIGEAFGERLDANVKAAAAAQAPPPGQPDPNQKMRVPVGNSPAKGGKEPLVTLVEFSSYQCPFCNRVRPTIDALAAEYGDDLRVVFKHRPLPMQQQSEPAARAAIAAQQQGKFWEFHAGLFENQGRIGPALFSELAESLGLDKAKFEADMASDATTQRLREDTSLADQVQAQGTPHFFINGARVVGAQPLEAFKGVVDKELANARKLVEAGTPRAAVYEKVQADAAERPTTAAAAPATPVTFKLDGAASAGPDDAKVTLVDFSDYQCGYCGKLSEAVSEVMPEFQGKSVRFVSMQFPLGRFPHSQKAAEAALAANAQGKYWEYKKLVYENQRALTDASFEQFAEQLGMDTARLRKELEDGTWTAAVSAQRAEGMKGGVSGTPALYLNGRKIGGALPPDALRSAINQALAQ